MRHAEDLRTILWSDSLMRNALEQARAMDLPDWWIVSGAVYNTVWNHLDDQPQPGHGIKDIDLFYFDPDTSWDAEDRIIRDAPACTPPLEIRNQARVHLWYQDRFGHPIAPLISCADSIARFAAETHAVGVRLTPGDTIEICAPFGLDTIFQRRMVPNPVGLNRETYEAKADRVRTFWPSVTIAPWPDVSVIRAQTCDWDALLALLHRAFGSMEGRINPASSLHRLTAHGLAEKAKAETCFLAHDGQQVTGCVFAAPRREALYIGKMAVDPDRQGLGIGRALMEACEAEARAKGLLALELQTRVELLENHATFSKMGFHIIGQTSHDGFDRPTSLTFRKRL